MPVKLLTQRHLEFLSLKGDYTGSSESTPVKMSHCWNSHFTAHVSFAFGFSQPSLFSSASISAIAYADLCQNNIYNWHAHQIAYVYSESVV